ncbi:NADPH:quinone reductase-like Zn-dependent oxidoreductase [Arcanobacterium wilhelmae]|uniref:NADPH:quinone reductase-like Zn-dependent oxidoreductase n=1 Tax=Arcanobacterium wilhelmae TaxID=1803177 RepID=A0ABT9NC29_9ACTO|nr:NADP-dependent oxidoreductase [Arcanobacterium wilhelmae]MDP9801282.1 NADPH:quinone reductase-like Zn-dependent oxidoreductase [Arcanobacterium wilhelmae]WFN90628.1 NADP-dependent oxidoreductase [Arcanobacterium wilhelmae]
MRKLMQNETGLDNIRLTDVEEPHAGPGQVRVAWEAGGVNPMDWKLATGVFPLSYVKREYPLGFGSDFAGVIDEVGEGVEGFEVGQRVLGNRIGEGFGDYIVNKPVNLHLLPIPDGMSFELAGALATVSSTAVGAIDDLGDINGQTILIGGGAGGVGTIAVQYAVSKGARVLATGSESSAPELRALGAEPVTYGDGLTQRVREALGSDTLAAAADLVNTDVVGAALELGVPAERITAISGGELPEGVKASGNAAARTDARADIVSRIAAGEIYVPIELSVPLERFREAIDRSMAGHVHGKVVITK